MRVLTGERRLRSNLCQQLCKVWKVAREELGLEDEVLARMCGANLAAQQFNLPGDPQR